MLSAVENDIFGRWGTQRFTGEAGICQVPTVYSNIMFPLGLRREVSYPLWELRLRARTQVAPPDLRSLELGLLLRWLVASSDIWLRSVLIGRLP